jgi:hypothetical protein
MEDEIQPGSVPEDLDYWSAILTYNPCEEKYMIVKDELSKQRLPRDLCNLILLSLPRECALLTYNTGCSYERRCTVCGYDTAWPMLSH